MKRCRGIATRISPPSLEGPFGHEFRPKKVQKSASGGKDLDRFGARNAFLGTALEHFWYKKLRYVLPVLIALIGPVSSATKG